MLVAGYLDPTDTCGPDNAGIDHTVHDYRALGCSVVRSWEYYGRYNGDLSRSEIEHVLPAQWRFERCCLRFGFSGSGEGIVSAWKACC